MPFDIPTCRGRRAASAVRKDPAADRSAPVTATAASGMMEGYVISFRPTGKVRRVFREFVRRRGEPASRLPKTRFGALSAAVEGIDPGCHKPSLAAFCLQGWSQMRNVGTNKFLWTRISDLQFTADRLDPQPPMMGADKRHHRLSRQSSSAIAKYADALRRISLARRNCHNSLKIAPSSRTISTFGRPVQEASQ